MAQTPTPKWGTIKRWEDGFSIPRGAVASDYPLEAKDSYGEPIYLASGDADWTSDVRVLPTATRYARELMSRLDAEDDDNERAILTDALQALADSWWTDETADRKMARDEIRNYGIPVD